jgi:hypothetical protein
MKISGVLNIGNGEKCPFCELIMTEDINLFLHMKNDHEDKMMEALFKEN